jgi:hypothetical protein
VKRGKAKRKKEKERALEKAKGKKKRRELHPNPVLFSEKSIVALSSFSLSLFELSLL